MEGYSGWSTPGRWLSSWGQGWLGGFAGKDCRYLSRRYLSRARKQYDGYGYEDRIGQHVDSALLQDGDEQRILRFESCTPSCNFLSCDGHPSRRRVFFC